jgi:anion-transporting  ArsA/GET3 family ATPase
MDEYAADEAIIKLERIAERRIQEAIEAGVFDNLQNAGQPLMDDDNPHVPPEMRAAFKVLQNSGYAPDWIVLAQQIENDIAQIRARADAHFAYLRSQLNYLAGDPQAVKRLGSEVKRLKALHRRAAEQHAHAIAEVNRKISTFNQTVPIASLLKAPLSPEDEMARYHDRVPAYLTWQG